MFFEHPRQNGVGTHRLLAGHHADQGDGKYSWSARSSGKVRSVRVVRSHETAEEIYSTPRWPSEPLFYASFTSKSDSSVAPKGHENMFLLMPIAPDLEDNKIIRKRYFELIISRLEKLTKQNIKDHIVYKKSYAIRDFKKDYHSFKGNAYGLANTLFQTAILKPSLKSKKLKNLYFCGQLTVPGPGVPPSLISGKVVANELIKNS